jgi:hypothetical protein
MKPDFSREEERAFTDRIDRAIKDAYQAAGKSSDAQMVERLFECLTFDDLTSRVRPSKTSESGLIFVHGQELSRLCVWTLKNYIERQIHNLQLRGEIRA